MGREATCNARLGRETGEGKALLETDEVIFRGGFRARVALRDLSAIEVRRGVLTLTWPGGTLALMLGEAAETWADAIRNPKSVVEKLGVKPGLKVAVLGGFEPGFLRDVTAALGARPKTRAAKGCALVFVRLARPGDEARLARLVPAIEPAGGVWAVYPKGRRELSEDTIRAAARRIGLVDVKVVRFSGELGALKLVIPRAKRGRNA
jgi:hypothetical protein